MSVHTPIPHVATLKLVAGIWLLAGCGNIRPATYDAGAPLRSADVLTAAEIAPANVGTAYDAVKRLRPAFLMSMLGPSPFAERAVYLDGVRLAGFQDLQLVPAAAVREIRFLNSVDATTRFGTGNSAGALVIVTLSGPR